MWKIPLSTPQINNEEIESVINILENKWLTMGDVTKKFEEEFSKKLNVKYSIAVTNCTAALHIANIALGIDKKSEVICPALTFVATANASKYTGANIIFADSISEYDLTIDPKDIIKKITKKTKAISVVHFAGFSCRMDEITKISNSYGLKIIEDCAHSPTASCEFIENNPKTGTMGDIGCFSFFSNKNMTTGEGGMITTNDEKLYEKMKLLRSHGMTSLTMDRYKGHANGYDVVTLGYNYRIDEIRSAIGLCQLNKIDEMNKKRRSIFNLYKNYLSNNNNVYIPFFDRDLNFSTPHIMVIIVNKKYEEIKNNLKENGIQISKHYDLIPSFSLYKKSSFISKIKNINNIITLPLSPEMGEENVIYITNIVNSI